MREESKSKSKEESTCCCVEGMADKLRKFENFFAFVFEKNDGGATRLDGIIRDVQEDGEILHMENVSKTIFFSNGSGISQGFNDLYISICEITEFSPQFEVTPATVAQVDVIKNQISKNSKATKIL
ncbi:UNVERIFIED_ORG: hypothetical protein ABIC97_005464 [Peribacillus simplex]